MWCVQTKVLHRGQLLLALTLLTARHLVLILQSQQDALQPKLMAQITSLLLMLIFLWLSDLSTLSAKEK
jgi:hypothetical protein